MNLAPVGYVRQGHWSTSPRDDSLSPVPSGHPPKRARFLSGRWAAGAVHDEVIFARVDGITRRSVGSCLGDETPRRFLVVIFLLTDRMCLLSVHPGLSSRVATKSTFPNTARGVLGDCQMSGGTGVMRFRPEGRAGFGPLNQTAHCKLLSSPTRSIFACD